MINFDGIPKSQNTNYGSQDAYTVAMVIIPGYQKPIVLWSHYSQVQFRENNRHNQGSQDKISLTLRKIYSFRLGPARYRPLPYQTKSLTRNSKIIVSTRQKSAVIPFWSFQNNQDVEKTKGVSGIRTRDVSGEGIDLLHYAIMSLERSLFNQIIKYFGITETVIYFTVYDSRNPGIEPFHSKRTTQKEPKVMAPDTLTCNANMLESDGLKDTIAIPEFLKKSLEIIKQRFPSDRTILKSAQASTQIVESYLI